MKIAILGGSFNPIHIGHLSLADEVCVSLGYDKVLFVPTFIPPHKEMGEAASAEARAKMVELACSKDSRFDLEDCEIKRGGVSYTYDTICFIEEKYKTSEKIGLIIGSDLFQTFYLWKNAESLSKKCNLILASRPFDEEKNEDILFETSMNRAKGDYQKAKFDGKKEFDIKSEHLFKNATVLKNKIVNVSSTEIRKRIRYGQKFNHLVPSKVFEYIIQGNLYERH